jgi:hypothetical protein
MEALILAIIIAYAVKKAAESAHEHWQASRGANRRSTRGQPVRRRAASAVRHDTAYWAEQVRGGFPQVRHGLYMGWHAGRVAQLEGAQARAQARTDHAELRARVTEAVREQRRRQDEALQRIRAAAAADLPGQAPGDPEPQAPPPGTQAPRQRTGPVCPVCRVPTATPEPCPVCRLADGGTPATPQQSTPTTEGNPMSGDTTYTQQLHELTEIRRDAEEEVNSVRRKRMANRLDVLMSLGLDKDTLSEAAAIDDALREQEKAAQQTLDAADAAIHGLQQRHGGIKSAVDDSPVDKPAEPEFYQD